MNTFLIFHYIGLKNLAKTPWSDIIKYIEFLLNASSILYQYSLNRLLNGGLKYQKMKNGNWK